MSFRNRRILFRVHQVCEAIVLLGLLALALFC